MDSQSEHDKAVKSHIALLQVMAALVSRLEMIHNKAKEFLIDFGVELDRIRRGCLATYEFETLDEISNISVTTSERLFRLRDRVVDCLSTPSEGLSSDDMQIVKDSLGGVAKIMQLFLVNGQGAEKFHHEFQMFAQRNFRSFLQDLLSNVEAAIKSNSDHSKAAEGNLGSAFKEGGFRSIKSALKNENFKNLAGIVLSVMAESTDLIVKLRKVKTAILRFNSSEGSTFLDSLTALKSDIERNVDSFVQLFNKLKGQWEQLQSTLKDIQGQLDNLGSLSAVQSRLLLVSIETLASIMDGNAKAVIYARAIGPMRK